jgi:hypothetical protein
MLQLGTPFNPWPLKIQNMLKLNNDHSY